MTMIKMAAINPFCPVCVRTYMYICAFNPTVYVQLRRRVLMYCYCQKGDDKMILVTPPMNVMTKNAM